MRRHLLNRLVFFLIGLALFYAPFALFTRLLLALTDSPLQADCHRVCLRMPIQWLVQPWMYPTIWRQPAYLVAVLILPATAFLLGPLFCGWLCPAGSLTEFLGRLVPDRFKLDLAGVVNPSPIRYGSLLALMAAPFLGGNLCCAFCNFAHMQSIVSAAFGHFEGLTHWASFTIVTFFGWFFAFGLFTKGGRGWCNFLCPAGAMQGLLHALGSRLKVGWAVRVDPKECKECGACVGTCPAWALASKSPAEINRHACNGCLDCVHACPHGAIRYRSWRDRTG